MWYLYLSEPPTAILYAGQDHLTARETVEEFARRFGCSVTVMENGEHWFHTEEQLAVLDTWLQKETEQARQYKEEIHEES